MGAYLSEPLTNKVSEEGSGNSLRHGGSSMQGWRASQEDAHHCVADYDEKSSLYGVYDGHGGAEIALYVAKHFPDLLKHTKAYLEGDIEKALVEAYLEMDASIKKPEVLAEIQKIAKAENGETEECVADYEEENVVELYEEATMPLDKLVAKYQTGQESTTQEATDEDEKPCSSKVLVGCSSSSQRLKKVSYSSAPANRSDSDKNDAACKEEKSCTETDEVKPEVAIIDEGKESNSDDLTAVSSTSSENPGNGQSTFKVDEEIFLKRYRCPVESEQASGNSSPGSGLPQNSTLSGNGDLGPASDQVSQKCNGDSKTDIIISETREINSSLENPIEPQPKPRKGKVHPVPVIITQTDAVSSFKRTSPRKASLLQNMAFNDSDSDLDSSDSDKPGVLKLNDDLDSDEDLEDSASSDSEEESDDEESGSDDSDEEEDDNFLSDIQEPGYDSGCTAVVAFLRWQDEKLHLWVANAGDSRCVVSREGIAVEMSYDHKPESEAETLRIVKAGGKVTDDGRVNGGLNLSRALGDHSYKQNTSLPPEEQMISPMPTIQHLELDPEKDDFVVLACDGVWNSMSSQEVVDFVRDRIKTAPTLSSICEELFSACLSDDTYGDGTGCDNMTAIIVQLPKQSSAVKRSIDECDLNEESAKKPKLEV